MAVHGVQHLQAYKGHAGYVQGFLSLRFNCMLARFQASYDVHR